MSPYLLLYPSLILLFLHPLLVVITIFDYIEFSCIKPIPVPSVCFLCLLCCLPSGDVCGSWQTFHHSFLSLSCFLTASPFLCAHVGYSSRVFCSAQGLLRPERDGEASGWKLFRALCAPRNLWQLCLTLSLEHRERLLKVSSFFSLHFQLSLPLPLFTVW